MCENCAYAEYDKAIEQFICTINFIIDEDDYFKINYGKKSKLCPYFKMENEYKLVNKQI